MTRPGPDPGEEKYFRVRVVRVKDGKKKLSQLEQILVWIESLCEGKENAIYISLGRAEEEEEEGDAEAEEK